MDRAEVKDAVNTDTWACRKIRFLVASKTEYTTRLDRKGIFSMITITILYSILNSIIERENWRTSAVESCR